MISALLPSRRGVWSNPIEAFVWRLGAVKVDNLMRFLGDPHQGGRSDDQDVVKHWKQGFF